MVTGRLYTSTNISVTPCSFVCNRNSLSKKAREKIVDLTSQLLAMPKKGNLLLRSRSGRMVTAEVAKTNPAVGVALQTLKEAYPDVNQALQKIEKAHSVTRALVDSYCRKQIKKQSRQILEAEAGLLPRSSMENKSGKQILEPELENTMSMHSLLETVKWQDYGHEWLNKRVVRDYGANGSNQGTITKWIPADRKGPEENMALWHVVFDDDDAEDLEKGEVEEALLLHASKQNKLASKKKTQLASKQNKLASAAKKLIKKAAAKKAAKEAAAKEAEAKQEAAKQEKAKQEKARAARKRKRKREKRTQPIKTAGKPANNKQKTAEVVTDEQIEANILSWLNPLKDPYAKPRGKKIAALAALELKSVPKTNIEVEAAYRRASLKYHSDKIPAGFSTSKRELYTEAFKELEKAKELVIKKICE